MWKAVLEVVNERPAGGTAHCSRIDGRSLPDQTWIQWWEKGPLRENALHAKKGDDARCAFCLGGHPPEETQTPQKLLLKYSRCFKCIEKGHRARNGKVTLASKGQHSTCLCEAKPSGNSGEPGNSGTAQLVGTKCRIALQTAQAMIKGGKQGRIRVLFDSGSHRSFVSARAASKYKTVGRKEWLTISIVGRKSESGLRDVVCFDVMPLRRGRAQMLEAYVVQEILHISNEKT